MPYRNVPPRERPWWEKLTALWMLLLAFMGIAGITWPSAALSSTLETGQLIYSALLISLGLAAFAAWWKGQRSPERVFMVGLGLLSVVHGFSLWWFAGGPGAQTGVRIIAAGVGTLAWIGIRYEFGVSRTQVQEVVAVVDDRDDGKG